VITGRSLRIGVHNGRTFLRRPLVLNLDTIEVQQGTNTAIEALYFDGVRELKFLAHVCMYCMYGERERERERERDTHTHSEGESVLLLVY